MPSFRDALDAEGWWYVAEVPCTTPAFTEAPRTESLRLAPDASPRAVAIQPAAQAVRAVARALPDEPWTTLTVADGAQGPRIHQFAALRGWQSRDEVPSRACWLVLRRNLDGIEPKYYLSNAPEETSLSELARVGGATRWTVETEFQTYKGQVGLDEYEVRSWLGWHHHVTLCLLANAFLLALQQDWTSETEVGKKHDAAASDSASLPATHPQAARMLRELLPRHRWTHADLRRWLSEMRCRNARATASHAERRRLMLHELSL